MQKIYYINIFVHYTYPISKVLETNLYLKLYVENIRYLMKLFLIKYIVDWLFLPI